MTPPIEVAEILSLVRASGGRATSTRRAILETLVAHTDTHPTAERIVSTVRGAHPDIAESTVYRFLDELQRLGVVAHVRLGNGPVVYHFAERAHHHHLVCDGCGAVVEVSAGAFDALRRTLLASHGFDLEVSHATLGGRCAWCRSASPPG